MPSKTRISVSELGTLIGTPFAPIIDALYFWARDAFNEGHDWKPEGKSQPSEAPVGGVRA